MSHPEVGERQSAFPPEMLAHDGLPSANLTQIRLADLTLTEVTEAVGCANPIETQADLDFYKDRIAATWNSLLFLFDPITGLPADRLRFSQDEILIAHRTKPTNIGLGLVSILEAESQGILDAEAANQRLAVLLDSLKKLERFKGFFLDWYDTQTGEKLTHWPDGNKPIDEFVSSVDNAWLAAALLVLQKAKPQFALDIQEHFLDQMNFESFFDPQAEELLGGWNVTQEQEANFHYSRDKLSEPRIVHWVTAALSSSPEEKEHILLRLLSKQGSVPDRLAGGAIFELLMPQLFTDEPYLQQVALKIFAEHRQYGEIYLRGAVGVSVADDPTREDCYWEMGVGGSYPESTVVSAYGAALAFLIEPVTALATFKLIEQIEGSYDKDYGYRDAVDIVNGKATQSQLFLDQALVMLSLSRMMQGKHIATYFREYFID